MPEDPSLVEIDVEGMQNTINETADYIDQLRQENQATEQAQEQRQGIAEQETAEAQDPRNKENWGFNALVKE